MYKIDLVATLATIHNAIDHRKNKDMFLSTIDACLSELGCLYGYNPACMGDSTIYAHLQQIDETSTAQHQEEAATDAIDLLIDAYWATTGTETPTIRAYRETRDIEREEYQTANTRD